MRLMKLRCTKVLPVIGICVVYLAINVIRKDGRRLTSVERENEIYSRMHANSSAKKPSQCLSLGFEEKMDILLSETKQVFVTMPTKAAGTSFKRFTSKCMKRGIRDFPDNFVNFADMAQDFLTSSLQLPSIISSHLFSDKPLVELARHTTRDTLIIYIHREETDRVLSAIEQVLTGYQTELKYCEEEHSSKRCTLDEEVVVNIIQNRTTEIGCGSPNILTCEAYSAIEQNAPNMVIVHYKQTDKLLKILAKHHCPDLLEEPPTRENLSAEKSREVIIRLKDGKGVVIKLEDWLREKRELIEWTLLLKKNRSGCQGMTRHMEDDLFACSHEAIRVFPAGIRHW